MLPYHPKALRFVCELYDATLIKKTYYSTGGGFVVQEGDDYRSGTEDIPLHFPIESAADLSK
jgi:L-serine dehydratase